MKLKLLQISHVHGSTGSAYIFMNIGGELHGYSLVTGLRVLKSNDGGRKRTYSYCYFGLIECCRLQYMVWQYVCTCTLSSTVDPVVY